MVLAKSFTIPGNVYLAAEKSVLDNNGYSWISFTPSIGGWATYYGYQKGETLSTKDIYGNTVRTDEQFYHDLADCLYDNPTLYYAYNKCSSTPTTYKVYLYPNGGVFSDGTTTSKTLEYTNRKVFTDFPTVTKANCELDGWNRDSANGTQYNTDVGPEDNGKSFYARWVCQKTLSNSSSSSSSNVNTFTVTFKNGTDSIFHQEKVKQNAKVNSPNEIPKREGYSFEGWITKDGEKFDFNTKITNNLTLYASWKVKTVASKSSSSRILPSSSREQISSKERPKNPQTGTFSKVFIVIIIMLTSIWSFIYYKNCLNNN